jgi:cellulose synthase/poly-beta-1,6-N-acetylglucosamine synthase-like glycosyltransferase
MSLCILLAAVACTGVGCYLVIIALGVQEMRRLGDFAGAGISLQPRVSVIVPACNEEVNIARAVLSLLAQDYDNLEILVVNDRSVDDTAAVLQRLQEGDPRLGVYEITHLPEGWMGKSHALARGAALVSGEYLLFTDADVVMEPTTISRAVRVMVDQRLDHLSLLFQNMTRGWLLNCLILELGLGLFCIFRPWTVNQAGSRSFMGIGAFNMVKRSAYDAVGGHEKIRMHPIDDLMLGKIIKEQGFRQDCLLAQDFVAVPWYDTVTAMVHGLQKNMFAFVHYRLALMVPLLLLHSLINILPFWGVIFCQATGRTLWVAALVLKLLIFFFGLRRQGLPIWYLPGVVLVPYIVLHIVITSVVGVLKNNGISWRGSHYPLGELKKSRPLFF